MNLTTNDSAAHPRPVPAAPVQIAPDLLSLIVGPVGGTSVLRPGQALELCALDEPGGSLLISKDHVPVAVLPGRGGLVSLYSFPQSAPLVWDLIAQLWPGIKPGQSFARFCVLEETNEHAFTPHYSLLDLEAMDVVLRAPRMQIEALCIEANRDAEAVLQRLAIAEITHALRTADPRLASVVAEQVWASRGKGLGSAVPDAQGGLGWSGRR